MSSSPSSQQRDVSPLFEPSAASSSPDVSGDESDPLMVEHDIAAFAEPMVAARSSSSRGISKSSKLLSSSSTPSSAAESIKKVLAFYVRFTASAGNQDKLLKLLQWSLWMLGAAASAAATKSSSSRYPQQQKYAAAWLHKLYGEVSFARYVTRLLGLPIALEAAVSDSWTTTSGSSSSNKLNRVYAVIGKVLAYSMVAYHPAELMAYVLWMKPPAITTMTAASQHPPQTSTSSSMIQQRISRWPAEKWSFISCRFWLAYVIAELVQCALQWRELSALKKKLLLKKKTDDDDDADEFVDVSNLDAQIANAKLQGLRDALFVVPCIQWSLPSWDTQPWLPVSTINSLLWFESIVCLYQALKNSK